MSHFAALDFACDAVTRYGEPVADAGVGHDHVRVPLTQQELARRNGCSAGTVSWYLRRLGPAVVARRSGIVFDRTALATLRTRAPRVAPRTAQVERELLECFARPTADGTCLELVVGDPTDPKPASLQDLATQLGINRSSVHRHVSALERAGHLQRRGRRLYTVPSGRPTKEPIVNHQPRAAGHGDVSPQEVFHLLEKVTDLLTVVAGMANQLMNATGAATAGAHDQRPRGAQFAAEEEVRAAPVADRGRGVSSDLDLIDQSDPEITSHQSSVRAQGPRERADLRADQPRSNGGGTWSPDDLPELLGPLLKECDRLGLPGVADARRVAASLWRYSSEQISTAARQMATDLRSGAPMRSPIAILVRKADDGDPYYFRATTAAEPTPPPPPPAIDEPEETVDAEAVAAVEQLDPDALGELDTAVAAHVRGILGERTSALSSPATWAYWRPIVWRQRHQPAAEDA